MKVGLNVALGPDSTDRGLLDVLGTMGWQVIRFGADPWWTDAQIKNVLSLFLGAAVEPLVILCGGHMVWPDGRRVEPIDLAMHAARVVRIGKEAGLASLILETGNEPDLAVANDNRGYNKSPQDCALSVRLVRDSIRALDAHAVIITAGISNLNDRGRQYLSAMRSAGLPDDVSLGAHRYSEKNSPQIAHLGGDREGEWRAFFGSEKRPIAMTEGGYHTAEGLTDQQVHDNLLWDLNFYNTHGVELAVCYQLNDGPQNIPDHKYGIRRLNPANQLDWKPSAYVAQHFRAGVTT